MSINRKTGRPNAALREGIAGRINDIRDRLGFARWGGRMATERALSEDSPSLITALDDVLDYSDECESIGVSMHPADVRSLIATALGVVS